MLVQNHAVIVGAGIAGLATAAALGQAGWSVTVHERATTPDSGGTALGMWPEAMRALDDIGVGDEVRRQAALVRGGTLLDPSGMPIARIPASRHAYLISRKRLLLTLLDAVPETCIRWSDGWTASDPFPDADLVVGADGIRSAIRSRVWRAPGERALGTVAFRGVVDGPVDSVSETWGRGALFGITPTGDGRTNWFACVRRDRLEHAGPDDAETLERLFSGWHADVGRVLAQLDAAPVDRRELFDVSLRHPYVRHNTALVGDAAHAMAPNLGRGACEALIDAVALARALEARTSVSDGLRRYDRVRRPPTRRLVRVARAVNRISTAERGATTRNRLMKLAFRAG